MTYPLKFRRKVLCVRKREGLTIKQTSARFSVGVASIVRWLKLPEAKAHRNKPATKIDMKALARDVARYPDAYDFERAERFGVSERGIGVALKRLGVTYKKSENPPKGGRRQKAHLPSED